MWKGLPHDQLDIGSRSAEQLKERNCRLESALGVVGDESAGREESAYVTYYRKERSESRHSRMAVFRLDCFIKLLVMFTWVRACAQPRKTKFN